MPAARASAVLAARASAVARVSAMLAARASAVARVSAMLAVCAASLLLAHEYAMLVARAASCSLPALHPRSTPAPAMDVLCAFRGVVV